MRSSSKFQIIYLQIFDKFDVKGVGFIDTQEILCAIILMSQSTFEQKAQMLFSLYDVDLSTTLSIDELLLMMTNALTALMILNNKQPPTLTDIESRTRSYFKLMDNDSDSKVNFNEFLVFLKKERTIVSAITNSGVASSSELGTDFGNGSVPYYDPDLELECTPLTIHRTETKIEKKAQIEQKTIDEFQEEDLGQGDQFMATRQKYVAPDGYKLPQNVRDPEASLVLDYAYGYRCHDVRNNLRYTLDGSIVYHCAGIAVVLDKQTNTQKHFISHRDDIHCLAISPNGTMCVTGEIGPKPRLCLWNCDTMEELAQQQIPLTKGIKHVAFSLDGQLVAASDMSDDHSIAVWRIAQGLDKKTALVLVAKGKGCRSNIMSLAFSPISQFECLVATCVKAVMFFQWNDGVIKGTRGSGLGAEADTILCQAYIGSQLFTGNLSGEIISWQGTSVLRRTKAHTQRINCMWTTKTGLLVTGSMDGKIKVWELDGAYIQSEVKSFDLKSPLINSVMPSAISVCEQNGNYLIGTRGGEIIEFDQLGIANVLMRSHCDSELWGLALHPTMAVFATWGRDALLCTWDINKRSQIQKVKLDSGGDALAYSNDGQYLALGFLNGQLKIVNAQFNQLVERKDRKGHAIQVIKFSPNDMICLTGGHDQLILSYDVTQDFKPLHKIKGHSSTVKFIDFSLDSTSFQSLCQAYETLYFDCATGKQITRGASQFKNETWASWTLTQGWPVTGIWPAGADGSDINAVDRSPDGTVIATADDFGTVKLFNFPSPQPKEAPHQIYYGHSSHVTNISFTRNKSGQRYLFTTGGEDKTVLQWKYSTERLQTPKPLTTVQQPINLLEKSKTKNRYNIGHDFNEESKTQSRLDTGTVIGTDPAEFEEEDLGDGDQALAVKPWLGAVKAMTPRDYKNPNPKAAVKASMELKWAHGFRSFDTTGNLKYNNEGNIIFTTAGVGVVQNLKENTQSFFNKHHEDIVSMAYHSGLNLVATGQMASKELTEASAKVNKKPIQGKCVNIYLWDATTCEQSKAPLGGFHRRAIRQLQFSPNGEYLLSIGEDDNHSVAVYNVSTRQIVVKGEVGPDKVTSASWASNNQEFAAVGPKFVRRFTIGTDLSLKKQNCQASQLAGQQFSSSCAYVLDNKLVSGTNQGNLVIWTGTSISKQFDAHTKGKSIDVIHNDAENAVFYTGGADGLILQWNQQFIKTTVVDLNRFNIPACGVRSFDISADGRIVVGTFGATILEVTNQGTQHQVLNQGHYKSKDVQSYQEIWGCATHPTLQRFATGGGDKVVRVWSFKKQEAVSAPLSFDPTSLDYSWDGKWIAVGDRNAGITILNAETLEVIDTCSSAISASKAEQIRGAHNFKTEQWVEVCRFSPDSTKIAFGHHGLNTCLEVVQINSKGKILTKPPIKSKMMPSAINHLDWSLDSQTIILTNTSYFVDAYSVQDKQIVQITSLSSLVNTDWKTWSLNLGWPVQGIYGNCIDLTEINTVERSKNGLLLATGNDSGQIKLCNWPCIDKTQNQDVYYGHSAHVTKAKFSADDDLLISTGGGDMTVFVWDTDIINLNSQAVYEEHPDDIEKETKFDLSRQAKAELKLKLQKEQQERLKQQFSDHYGEFIMPEFQEKDLGQGDEFLAVKPWKGQIKPPSTYKRASKNSNTAPDIQLQLEWVHGYKGSHSQNNLKVMQDGNYVYYAAGVTIQYNPITHTQQFFQGHHDDVTSIAYSPNRVDVAVGELGKKPSVFVIDTSTMQVKQELKGNGITSSILQVAYSPSGNRLGMVAGDQEHTIAIYDTADWKLVTSGRGDRANIVSLAFENDTTWVTVGSKHFKQYQMANAGKFTGKLGNFAQLDQRISGCVFNGADCLTGCINGDLYKWNGTSVSIASPKLHDRLIDAILVSDQNILTGGRDSQIKILSKDYKLLYSIDATKFTNSISQQIRALSLNDKQDKLIIGTFGHEIIELPINIQSKTTGQEKVVIHGHYAPVTSLPNEAWGLCIFNNSNQYATVSDDATMRIWDQATRKQICMVSLEFDLLGQPIPRSDKGFLSDSVMARAIDINKSDELIALGMRDGTLRVYQARSQQPYWQCIAITKCAHKIFKPEWIEDLKFSPDDKYLIVTSHNNRMYLFETPNFDSPISQFGASSSFITHVDWSIDSNSVRTNDGSYEILYYSIPDGKLLTSGATQFRDEPWATQSCVLGWGVQGIWQSGYDGSDINHADRSHRPVCNDQQLVATADDRGLVSVFRYPCPIDSPAKGVIGHGHSSHVTKVRFSQDDSYIFSTGGNDTTVMQWKVVKE